MLRRVVASRIEEGNMTSQTRNLSIAVIVTSMLAADCASVFSEERFSFSESHLGTIVELTIYASDQTAANEAARVAFRRIKELDLIFSDYKTDSEVMKL